MHASPAGSGTLHAGSQELEALRAEFGRIFGDAPHDGLPSRRIRMIRAPGRVNLIGEHTDYNDGFVFPMAIEQNVLIVCRSRDDGLVRLASAAFPQEIVEFSVQAKVEKAEPAWANYSRGVAAQLLGVGIPLVGIDALIENSLPVGAGLSSSAAIEVGTGQALLQLAGLEMDKQRLALLCQKAEHEFADVPCGIMDQTIVAGGKDGHAMLLDCRDLSKQHILVDSRELRVVIVNSMSKHQLSGGEYAERRAQCEEGVALFKKARPDVKALRDVTPEQLAAGERKLSEVVYRRCHHVVSEIARTIKAAGMLAQKDYDEVGQLMLQSHASLRYDFEVSTEELDALVEESMQVRGVYGARMTGAGFGGSIVALVQPRAVDALKTHLLNTYSARFGKEPQVYVTTATAGVATIE